MRDISILRTFSVMLLFSATLVAQVKIGDHPEQINPYALLELESTDKGLLIPRFTEVQRDQEFKESLPDGLLIYNLDKACLEVWKAKTAQWECIGRATEEAFQELRLEDHLLTLTDGGSVDLRPYLNVFTDTNTDEQLLSLQGHQLTLTNGGSVDLSAIANSGTDSQTLQLVGDVLSISGANSVSIAEYTNTDSQTVSAALLGNILHIKNEGQTTSATVDLSTFNNSGTDLQTLSLVGDVLSISGTNSVSLAGYSKTNSQTTGAASSGNIFSNDGEISENRTLKLNRNKFIFENGPLYLNSNGRIVAYSLSATSSGTGSNRLISKVNAVTLFLGPDHSVSKFRSDQSSGDIRFNGLDLKHGDLGFYPTGGNAGGKGHFRFSLTDKFINHTPDAKLGMGDLYVANSIGIGITSPTAKLDVEGEIRLRSLTEQTTTTTYENVLVADNDGNVAKVKSNLLNGGSSSIFSSDGTLTESRTIDLNNNDFSFTNGNVGIGTQSPNFTLTVSGSIGQTGAIAALHPDYVFEHYFDKDSSSNANYIRYSLEEVEEFIRQHKHLPGVQSRETIEASKSWNISENVRTNLEKIEELYLHTIEQQKKIEMLMQSLQALEYKLNERMKKK